MPDTPAARFNDTLLASHERRVLLAIARRLPGRITPDNLTCFGLFGALLVTAGGLLSRQEMYWLWLANFGLVIHWFGDSLDGTVARLRQIERPRYGFYLDQVIDTVGNLLISLGVGLCPAARMDLTLILLAIYQMLTIQVLVRAIVDREFHMAVGRMGPTELRIGIFTMNIAIMVFGGPKLTAFTLEFTWCDAVMTIVAIGLLALFAFQMKGHLSRLAKDRATKAVDPDT